MQIVYYVNCDFTEVLHGCRIIAYINLYYETLNTAKYRKPHKFCRSVGC